MYLCVLAVCATVSGPMCRPTSADMKKASPTRDSTWSWMRRPSHSTLTQLWWELAHSLTCLSDTVACWFCWLETYVKTKLLTLLNVAKHTLVCLINIPVHLVVDE